VLITMIVGRLRQAGYVDVHPMPSFLRDEDAADLVMAIENAFGRLDGLMPSLINSASIIYRDAWLDRSGLSWPFAIVDDAAGMMGVRVQWVEDAAPLAAALLCVIEAIKRWVVETPPPVLTLE